MPSGGALQRMAKLYRAVRFQTQSFKRCPPNRSSPFASGGVRGNYSSLELGAGQAIRRHLPNGRGRIASQAPRASRQTHTAEQNIRRFPKLLPLSAAAALESPLPQESTPSGGAPKAAQLRTGARAAQPPASSNTIRAHRVWCDSGDVCGDENSTKSSPHSGTKHAIRRRSRSREWVPDGIQQEGRPKLHEQVLYYE